MPNSRWIRRGPVVLLFSLAAALNPARAVEQPPQDVQAAVDSIVRPLIDTRQAVGIAVGVITGGKSYVFGYGEVRRNSGHRPDGDTVFEIGSITKVFTATLLAGMARDGLVKLEAPVRLYLPPEVSVPAFQGREITTEDLSSQVSGLPRLPSNLWTWKDWLAGLDKKNPYARYTVAQLYQFLSGYTLQRAPGDKYEYSNLGVGLLGHALALKAGKSYEDLVIERICKPLDMPDTRITLSEGQRPRLAQAYQLALNIGSLRIVRPASNWDIPTLAGAGALRSTVNDQLKFLAANLGLTQTDLLEPMRQTHTSRHDIDAHMSIGLGWHVSTHAPGPILWHNGQTGGYHSFAGFIETPPTAVVMLTNTAASVDAEATTLLERLSRAPFGSAP